MSGVSLAIVAPRLPPQACGIGTYAWQLDQHWPDESSAHQFLVYADAAASREALPNTRIDSFPATAGGLADTLAQQDVSDVLLHYAGRAYHRYGFPRWMPDGFSRWLARDPAHRLHVIFHELPADLPLLSRHGILQRLSFPVAQRLAEQATTVITNSEHHASVLSRWKLRSPARWFPVPSNISPPSPFTAGARPAGHFAIFGLPYTRLQTLRIFRESIAGWARSGRLSRLHLIGPCDDKFSPEADALLAGVLRPNEWSEHGEVSAADVSKFLLGTEFCLSMSNEFTWSKSGAFMAYAAHQSAVVVAEASSIEPLRFAIPAREVQTITPAIAAERAQRLRAWYVRNADWDLTATRIAELIGPK